MLGIHVGNCPRCKQDLTTDNGVGHSSDMVHCSHCDHVWHLSKLTHAPLSPGAKRQDAGTSPPRATPKPPPEPEQVRPRNHWSEIRQDIYRGIEVPCRADRSYREFQKEAIHHLYRQNALLLADEMGLGKTIEAIGLINALDLDRVLIICPAFLRLNWKRELEEWLTRFRGRPIDILGSDNYYNVKPGILIASYTGFRQYEHVLRKTDWQLIIGDEAHKIKNPQSLRSRAFRQLKAERRLLMTGTPILNRPAEMWALLDWLQPGKWEEDADSFAVKWDSDSMLEVLHKRLRSCVMLRRLKSEVLKELPPKQRQVIDVPASGELAVMVAEEHRLCAEANARRQQLQRAASEAKALRTDVEYKQALRALREWQFKSRSALSGVRHTTALSKAPAVIDHIKLVLENENKVICFAHHRDVVEKVAEAFGDRAVYVHGGVSQQDRSQAVTRFQTEDRIHLFVGGIHACGQGITLTAASTVIFAELDWTPAMLTQCEDRAHRIGQDADSVLCQHLVVDGSIDSRLAEYLVKKQEIIAKTIDGEAAEVDEDFLEGIVWSVCSGKPAADYSPSFRLPKGDMHSASELSTSPEDDQSPEPAPPEAQPRPALEQGHDKAGLPSSSFRRACHEAGHVVVLQHMGYEVTRVSLASDVPQSEAWESDVPIRQWVTSRRIDGAPGIPDVSACHFAAATLAGKVAEELFASDGDVSQHAHEEVELVSSMSAGSEMDEDEAEMWVAWREATARRILQQEEERFLALREALLKARALDAQAIASVLVHNGNKEEQV